MTEVTRLGEIAMQKTSAVGSTNVGSAFEIKSKGRPVKWAQACWNGEVIKGIALKFHGDDTRYTVGDWDNRHSSEYHRSTVDLASDDLLRVFKISTSHFGYRSVRGFVVETRAMSQVRETWNPGNVTDPHSQLDVIDRYWMGIYGTVNPDQFINSLGLWVSLKK